MASIFPTIPYVVFCVLEPISLVAGFAAAFFDTTNFINDQFPQSILQKVLPPTNNATILAYQLGNLYGLMCMLGLAILNTTSEKKVAKAYIVCLAIADIGHVAPTMYVLGQQRVLDIANYNVMAWGNIVATFFLFFTRLAYLAGVFGDGPKPKSKKA